MKSEFNCVEKYTELYSQYRKMFKDMLKAEQYSNLSKLTVIELSSLAKEKYPTKSNAIERANFLFSKPQNLDNLKELLNIYEFIKE